MRPVKLLLAVVCGALVVLWVLSLNPRGVSSVLRLNGCIPPLDHPAPRREGYAQAYEHELMKQAIKADSDKVCAEMLRNCKPARQMSYILCFSILGL